MKRNGFIIVDFFFSIEFLASIRTTVNERRRFSTKEKTNLFDLELKNIHYAKSIKIVTTLTADTSYILPPVLQIEYAELSSSDISTGKLVQVSRFFSRFSKLIKRTTTSRAFSADFVRISIPNESRFTHSRHLDCRRCSRCSRSFMGVFSNDLLAISFRN